MARGKLRKLFDWETYGKKVLNGEVIVPKTIIQAVKRHYRDLETLKEFYFDEDSAQFAIQAFLFMKHSKGEFAGQQFVPSEWQQFWIALLFGWKRKDGSRRFREFFLEVARKNGKTTLLAGIGVYMLLMDGEAGAEVYAAATKLDQAKVLYDEAKNIIRGSPLLRSKIKVLRDSIDRVGERSFMKALGRDSKSMDGLNPNCGIIDETHAHKNSDIYDVLKSALGARKQPLMCSITTAGFDLSAYGYEQHVYAMKVLNGELEDNELLPVVYTVDDPDRWFDPNEWHKANPNMGISVYPENMQMDFDRASKQKSQQANFKTKRLNIWLTSGETWIPTEEWRACGDPNLKIEDFRGEKCWIGIDLAEKSDIAALAIVFERQGHFYVFFRLYLNEFEVTKPENQHYRNWRDKGELIVTEGNATDFDVIRFDLNQLTQDFRVLEVPYDPHFAAYFATKLIEEGMPMIEIAQTSTHFTQPIIEIENMVLEKKLHHQGSSLVEWMMSNVVMRESKFSGLRHPTKETAREKIDGPVAMLMAVGRALQQVDDTIKQGFVVL